MNPLVFHIVSGDAFYSGVALLLAAAVASIGSKPIHRRLAVLTFLIGVLVVVLSSTALPIWCYGVAGGATLFWIGAQFTPKHRRLSAALMAASWLFAVGVEAPYHVQPTLSPARERSLTIVGDSVTAGIGGDERSETWPRILAREHHVRVQDISHMGETAASALVRAKSHEIDSPVVVVEIGGNDVLGSTTAAQFARDLDALLSHLTAPDRQIVMFELPLPPFYHAFGRIQREAAQKHHLQLIPRRVFLSLIADSAATLDTIHLSQSGHQQMADRVWSIVESAFPTSSTR